jgi:hypothetical protein
MRILQIHKFFRLMAVYEGARERRATNIAS